MVPFLHSDRYRLPTRILPNGSVPPWWGRVLLTVVGIVMLASPPLVADSKPKDGTPKVTFLSEIEPWLDGYINAQLDSYWIAGAAVSVVADDEVLSRGYGFRDPIDEIPVDPDTTLFRIASISKTFTWAAVMELISSGELNFHEDIAVWIGDDPFPKTDRPEITLHDLITHRGGFEDQNPSVVSNEIERTLSTREYVATRQPDIIYEPGEVFAYSNFGASLAGFIVESVTDTSWEDWIYTRYMIPAGMQHGSTPYQNGSVVEQRKISSAWSIEDGWWQEEEYRGFNGAGAGAISAGATDMAQWLRVLLNDGSIDGRRVLSRETVSEMVREREGYHRNLRPLHYGFFSYNDYGTVVLGHGGHFDGHVSQLVLYPDHNVGVFIAYNGYAPDAVNEFRDAFTRKVTGYPSPAIGLRPTAGYRASQSQVEAERESEGDEEDQTPPDGFEIDVHPRGFYVSTRSNRSTMEKSMALWDCVRVRLDKGNGDLEMDYVQGGYRSLYWDATNTWSDYYDPVTVAVEETRSGERLLYVDGPPGSITAMLRVNWYEFPPIYWVIYGAALIAFNIAVVWIPLAPLVGCRRCEREKRRARRPLRGCIWLLSATAVPALWVTLITFVSRATYAFGDPVFPRIIALSHSVFFIVLSITIVVTLAQRIRHPLGRKSIPFLTRPLIALGILYTIYAVVWNLVPWRMAWVV